MVRLAGLLMLIFTLSLSEELKVTGEVAPVFLIERASHAKRAASIHGKEREVQPLLNANPSLEIPGWKLIDSLHAEPMLLAGDYYAVIFDYEASVLKDTLHSPFVLPERAQQVVERAPQWLRNELSDNLRRLMETDPSALDLYATFILEVEEEEYLDEMCFTTAHISPNILSTTPPELLYINAQYIYEIAPELAYVRLVEYGEPGSYYTTTRYCVAGDTGFEWLEVPREIYYWWIVHPKLSDEVPSILYGTFWRDDLYHYADPGYPLLKDALAEVRFLWDKKRHVWANKDPQTGEPYEYGDSLSAVQAVGRWVAHTLPRSATDPRPIQPSQLLRDHDGNCGECQDLLCAGARTALIPCLSVMDINEDHVWNGVPWPDSAQKVEDYPYQVDLGGGVTHICDSTVSYDARWGGGKEVSCVWNWRGDGYQWSDVERYSGACTLTVVVFDKNGAPLDGVNVNIDSKFLYGGTVRGFGGVTNKDGEYTTTLGDWNYYILRTVFAGTAHDLGTVVEAGETAPGAHFIVADTFLEVSKYRDDVDPRGSPTSGDHMMRVRAQVSRDVLYGFEYTYANPVSNYASEKEPGHLDLFILDEKNFSKYLHEQYFLGYALVQGCSSLDTSLIMPSQEDYYAVFSNRGAASATSLGDITVYLYEREEERIAEPSAPRHVFGLGSVAPIPFVSNLRIEWSIPEKGAATLTVYDVEGRFVESLVDEVRQPGLYVTELKSGGGRMPSGIYFCELRQEGRCEVRKIVKVR